MPKVQIVFYSMYGHIYRMAEAVAQGAREVADTQVELFQVPELVPEEALVRTGAKKARDAFAHIPIAKVDHLPEADALIFGCGTRYGSMAAQMRNFLDQTGQLWAKGALVNKVGSAFTSTATQHGGQETTLMTFHVNLLHFGMVLVGVPYAETRLMELKEVSGGSPYGASTITGGDGSRMPSENELGIAKYQGRHIAEITAQLMSGKLQTASR
jgi:NAD(P)H dehydrogenase (quinone)